MVEGDIRVGDRLVWYPNDPNEREPVRVASVIHGGLWLYGPLGQSWHAEDTVRRECVRAPDPA